MHVCGQCGQQFENLEAYLNHVCPVTGVAPNQPTSPDSDIAKAALARGAKRKELEAQASNPPAQQ